MNRNHNNMQYKRNKGTKNNYTATNNTITEQYTIQKVKLTTGNELINTTKSKHYIIILITIQTFTVVRRLKMHS